MLTQHIRSSSTDEFKAAHARADEALEAADETLCALSEAVPRRPPTSSSTK
jgi:hypothetical protein